MKYSLIQALIFMHFTTRVYSAEGDIKGEGNMAAASYWPTTKSSVIRTRNIVQKFLDTSESDAGKTYLSTLAHELCN